MTSSFLATLPMVLDRLGSVAQGTVRSQTLDLIALSLGKSGSDQVHRTSSARSLVRMKVRAAIEKRLNEVQVDTESVAAAAGISVRYANAVLADEGTSISRLIQERRLLRCRSAFEDPAQSHRTVSEIAYNWGFSDMTHFGRKFKATFGQLPSEYRRSVIEARQPKKSDVA